MARSELLSGLWQIVGAEGGVGGGAEFEAGLCPIQIAWNVSMQMTNVSSVDFI